VISKGIRYCNDHVMPSMGAISGAASFRVPTAWIGNNERLSLPSLARRERAARDASFSFVHPRHISGGMRPCVPLRAYVVAVCCRAMV
jgi:hypothetical protein